MLRKSGMLVERDDGRGVVDGAGTCDPCACPARLHAITPAADAAPATVDLCNRAAAALKRRTGVRGSGQKRHIDEMMRGDGARLCILCAAPHVAQLTSEAQDDAGENPPNRTSNVPHCSQ